MLSVSLLLFFHCGSNVRSRMLELKKNGKFLELSILCAEHTEQEYEDICNEAWKETSLTIDGILSQKADLPFLRISVDEKTRKQVEELLAKNPQLREKYLPLWKKFIQE
ncbi:hypothetical protein LEP1GSC050_1067 [Leptospira broomii serovar Hurstbridge str. 5399]|uniref:Uncharacterized protein n=2 Tax=Leptospira broomii TaxID=301541 RepID=T0F6K9_9LEPT|nr:hypothetical protein LEP1GSC050_1067 [Leptospira broomii serovar Hurstbridge str. 5399]